MASRSSNATTSDDVARPLPSYATKSLKGSLGSLYNLNQRQLLGSNSALQEWNYVMTKSTGSSAPSVAGGIDRGSVSGISYATKKTGRGWDNTVQFWDTRIGHSVRSFYGPHICGTDALEFNQEGTEILTASFSKQDQLQTWDFGSGTLIDTIPWSIMEGERGNSLLYSGSFGKSKAAGGGVQYAIAGGCGAFNEVKLFNMQTKRAIGVAQGFTHSVYSVCLSNNERMVAVGGGFKSVYSYDIDFHQQASDLIY
ncbi:hypothetical protein HDU98_003763 [Podochytrium sp. JEL0797]|nr:hypothetical protein HDU98_003763 [Podochytrium sp. JEL0797]